MDYFDDARSNYLSLFNHRDLILLDQVSVIKNSYPPEISVTELMEELSSINLLFNRVRLMILFILKHNWSLQSSELRSLLDISWGSYISNINVLEKAGYIEYENQFIDTNVSKVVRISQKGLDIWYSFIEILELITTKTLG